MAREGGGGMNAIFKFVAGNSRVTPVGVALAVLAAVLLSHRFAWIAVLYPALLLGTLALSTLERV